MKRLTAALLFAALLLPLHGQNDGTYTPGNREEAVAGPLRSSYVKTAGRGMVDVRDLDGAFVKTATKSGSVLTLTTQLANNTEATVTFTDTGGGGGGTADGVLTMATYNATTKMITLVTGAPASETFTLNLSALQNATDVGTLITNATSSFITAVSTTAPISGDGSSAATPSPLPTTPSAVTRSAGWSPRNSAGPSPMAGSTRTSHGIRSFLQPLNWCRSRERLATSSRRRPPGRSSGLEALRPSPRRLPSSLP